MRNSESGTMEMGAAGHEWDCYSATAWARLYQEPQGEGQAEALLRHALALQERSLGPGHPMIAATLTNLMFLYRRQGKAAEAAAAAVRATDILAGQARPPRMDEPALPAAAGDEVSSPAPPQCQPLDEIELSELTVEGEYRPSLSPTDLALAALRPPDGDGWQPGWWKLGRQPRWQYGWTRRRQE